MVLARLKQLKAKTANLAGPRHFHVVSSSSADNCSAFCIPITAGGFEYRYADPGRNLCY
jgi:hypothetical protein